MIDQNVPEFEKMNLNKWHSYGYKGKGSNLVVLDVNGVPHDFTNVIQPIKSGYEGIGHQTNVCSVIREIAPEATIYSFHWTSSFKDEIIDWIDEHQEIIDAINFSVSGRSVREEFKELEKFDIPVIVASGNDGREDRINPYAQLDWTIGVGAWNEIKDSAVSYSNAGESVDIVAYTNIYIPSSDGYDRVFAFNGTSCSAPVVTGLIGVYNSFLLSKGLPKLGRKEAKEFLLNNTVDKMEVGHDYKSGFGLAVLPKDFPELEVVVDDDTIEDGGNDLEFKDIELHWAKEYVDFVVEKEIMNGFPDGTFQPNKVMTRAEVATVIARMLGFVPVKK